VVNFKKGIVWEIDLVALAAAMGLVGMLNDRIALAGLGRNREVLFDLKRSRAFLEHSCRRLRPVTAYPVGIRPPIHIGDQRRGDAVSGLQYKARGGRSALSDWCRGHSWTFKKNPHTHWSRTAPTPGSTASSISIPRRWSSSTRSAC
jgi:hypothetical protein